MHYQRVVQTQCLTAQSMVWRRHTASAWFSAPLRWLAHAAPYPLEPMAKAPQELRNQSATMQSLACLPQ